MARSFQEPRVFGHMTVIDNVLVARPKQTGERLLSLFLAPRLIARAERSNQKSVLE